MYFVASVRLAALSVKVTYCDVPGSPCLSKIRRVKCAVPLPRVLSLPGRFVGDPASLARDKTLIKPACQLCIFSEKKSQEFQLGEPPRFLYHAHLAF